MLLTIFLKFFYNLNFVDFHDYIHFTI